jgi:hypothetical protein
VRAPAGRSRSGPIRPATSSRPPRGLPALIHVRDLDRSALEQAASQAVGAIPVASNAVNRNNRMEFTMMRQLP